MVLKQYQTADNLNIRIQLHEKYSTNPIGFHEWVFDRFQLQEGMKILECGVGTGALWFKNREKVPPNCHITMLDLSKGMLETAKNNIGAVPNVEFEFLIRDIQKMDFKDDQFDVIIANHMLYHITDIDLAIRETKRVLKFGGTFFASTFGQNHLEEIDRISSLFINMSQPRTSDRFVLENGCYKILNVYGNLLLRKQNDSLKVTDPQDLIDYVLSGTLAKEQLVGDKLKSFVQYVNQLFKINKIFCIKKDTGVFIAKKEKENVEI